MSRLKDQLERLQELIDSACDNDEFFEIKELLEAQKILLETMLLQKHLDKLSNEGGCGGGCNCAC